MTVAVAVAVAVTVAVAVAVAVAAVVAVSPIISLSHPLLAQPGALYARSFRKAH